MEALNRLTASEAARQIRQSVITAEALAGACLHRIREREPAVGAWAHLDEELVLRAARGADARLRRAEALGPLHGVPVAIKDIIDTEELPTEHGTPVFAGRRPSADAEVVRRLKAAGAIVLGKTVTTELAFFGPGRTRNPHQLEHTPGGSSSGSAAAVADFHVPLALGTQTAGSIIRPASYCGVLGFKPTFGTVPREGVLEQSPPLDTVGGYARSVEDLAILTSVLTGSPFSLGTSLNAPSPRLAFVRSPAWPEGEPVMQAAILRFAGEHPDLVKEVELPKAFAGTGGLQRAVQFCDIARNYGPLLDAHPGRLSGKLAEVVEIGRGVTGSEYEAALGQREPLYSSLAAILSEFDAILTPAAGGPAPKGLASTGSPAFNFLWTFLGMPAVSLPLLEADGLPLGVQLVGRRNGDVELLRTAAHLMGEVGRPGW